MKADSATSTPVRFFNPTIYFAYHNEPQRITIGHELILRYRDLDVEIYSILESIPEFYPIKNLEASL
jgi:hypothetical protein